MEAGENGGGQHPEVTIMTQEIIDSYISDSEVVADSYEMSPENMSGAVAKEDEMQRGGRLKITGLLLDTKEIYL